MTIKNVAVYPVSAEYLPKVEASIKSLMINSDVDKIILLTETSVLPEYMPDCVMAMDVRSNRYFSPSSLNAMRSHHAYLCELRVALADFLHYDRVLSLDADTIFVQDVKGEPWEMDIAGCHMAGVPEVTISNRRGKPYANAGVLIFDLNRIRMDKLADPMVDALNTWSYQWLEQDCLNEHLDLYPLGSEWNACQFTAQVDDDKIKIRHFAYEPTWEQSHLWRKYQGMSWSVVESIWEERRHGL